ncbi:hypothetical protein AgCh_040416 [Apium graveolens]
MVNCVSGVNGTVVAVPRRFSNRFTNRGLTESCEFINLTGDVLVGFGWVVPFCQRCEIENGTCGYQNVETMKTGCSLPSTTDFCPPTVGDFIPLGSPFIAVLLEEYFIVNCSSSFIPDFVPFEMAKCISTGVNATAIAIPSSYNNGFINRGLPDSCQNIIAVTTIPVGFAWGLPSCGRCERRNGTCGYKNVQTMEIGCSVPSKNSLSTAAKYGIVVGAGLPGILLLICLASFAKKKMNDRNHIQLRQHVQNLPTTTISLEPPRLVTGLDKLTIDSYPMTVLGESKRLPNPSDSTCAICLSEYQPNDTLRTVPECNHYFHSHCIDEWLKLNATCPVCRNFPEGSSGRAATDPLSSSSSPTSLFSN